MPWYPHNHDDRYVKQASQLWDEVVENRVDKAATEAAIARAATNRYDVRQWGNPFSAEPGALFASAMTDIAAADGGVLTGPAGAYTFTTGFQQASGVVLDFPGAGNTHFDFSGLATPVSDSAIYGAGSVTALPALASSVAQHATTLTFATAPSVSPGDWLIIQDSADGSWNAARTYYRAGEHVQVLSVASTTVTLTQPTFDAYASGGTVSVSKVTPFIGGARGFRATFPTGVYGIQYLYGYHADTADLVLEGSDWAQLRYSRSFHCHASNVRAYEDNAAGGLNYGIAISHSQALQLSDCDLESTRHGLTIGGGGGEIGTVPNRDILIHGGRIAGHGDTGGADMHGNCEYVQYLDVDMPNGLILGGDKGRVVGGRIRTHRDGFAIEASELLGWDWEIDTDIEATAPADGNAVVRFASTANTTRTGGHFRFGGRLTLGGYGTAGGVQLFGVFLDNAVGPSADADVTIDAEITSTMAAYHATLPVAVYIRSGAAGTWRDLDISLRTRRLGILINTGFRTLDLHDCHLIEPPERGIYVRPVSSTYDSQITLRSRDNVIERAGRAAYFYWGLGVGTGTLIIDGDQSIDCNQSSGTNHTQDAGLGATEWGTVIYRHAIIRSSDGKIVNRDGFNTITTLIEQDTVNLGTVTTERRSAVTTRRYRGSGAGAPAFAAAVGSEYNRTDGGTSTTKYLNETGTSTWRAV